MVSALPFWAGILATLAGGRFGDYLVKRGVSNTLSRKSIIGTGLIAAMVFVSFAAVAQRASLAVTRITCVSAAFG